MRVGCSERTALKQVYYQVWNRSPAQVGCMRQVLRAGALGRPRGMGWGGRWDGGSGWGAHVNPWLIHVNVWQKPLQYCKVISLQLIKIIGNKKKEINCGRRIYTIGIRKRYTSGLLFFPIEPIVKYLPAHLCFKQTHSHPNTQKYVCYTMAKWLSKEGSPWARGWAAEKLLFVLEFFTAGC